MPPLAMTVLGPVDPSELGMVLVHEHVLHSDCYEPAWFEASDGDFASELADAPVTVERLAAIRANPFACRANNQLRRDDPLEAELAGFRDAGGSTVVDLTSQGLHPDPEGLRELASRAGVHLVAGCGWYVDHVLPEDFARRSIDELTAEIVRAIREGIDGTSVRAGVIGEIGTSAWLTDNERRSLRAAALAGVETGAAVVVHLPGVRRTAFEVLHELTSEGLSPERIVMAHMDAAQDIGYAKAVADRGCVVSFDGFGADGCFDSWHTVDWNDRARVQAVAELVEAGHSDRITVSHGVFHKHRLTAYGGRGFEHIPRTVVPQLRHAGLTCADTDAILRLTPQRLLALQSPDIAAAALDGAGSALWT